MTTLQMHAFLTCDACGADYDIESKRSIVLHVDEATARNSAIFAHDSAAIACLVMKAAVYFDDDRHAALAVLRQCAARARMTHGIAHTTTVNALATLVRGLATEVASASRDTAACSCAVRRLTDELRSADVMLAETYSMAGVPADANACVRAVSADDGFEATCYICFETLDPVLQQPAVDTGCACKGRHVHAWCHAMYAANRAGRGCALPKPLGCEVCAYSHTSSLEVAVEWVLWERHRRRPRTIERTRALANLGRALCNDNAFDAAEVVLIEAMGATEDLGTAIEATAITLQIKLHMANVMSAKHKFDEAEILYIECINGNAMPSAPPTDLANEARSCYGLLLLRSRREDAAVKVLAHALREEAGAHGKNSELYMELSTFHGSACVNAGRIAEGTQLLEDAASRQRNVLGRTHRLTAYTEDVKANIACC